MRRVAVWKRRDAIIFVVHSGKRLICRDHIFPRCLNELIAVRILSTRYENTPIRQQSGCVTRSRMHHAAINSCEHILYRIV